MKPVKCVVVPKFPPIDKYIAAKRVMLDLEHTHRVEIAFCDKNIPTPEDHARWDAMCSPGSGPAYLIDIGEKKYHKIAGSASAVEKMSSETQNGRTWNRLAEMAAENNRTGHLKQARHSVAKLVRDTYHVMNSGEASQDLVFDHCMDVVNGFFFPQNKREWESLFAEPAYEDLRKLWDGFNVQEKEVLPFTLPLYFRQLFMSGRSPQEIHQKISWWLDKAARVLQYKEAAGYLDYFPRRFTADGKPCAFMKVTNYFEAEAFIYQWIGSGKVVLGIVRSETGHVLIQPSFRHKVDLKKLFTFLDRHEPGRWYFEDRFNKGRSQILMNGSRQFTGVSPTGLSDDQLQQAITSLMNQ